MNYQEALLALEAGKKLKRAVWKSLVICKKLTGADMIPWRKEPEMAQIINQRGIHMTMLDTILLFDIPQYKIYTDWRPTTEDMEADDWKTVLVKPHQCKVCGKWFDYGDEHSPVFKDEVWNHILKTFGFPELQPITKEHPHDDSGFICYECVEKALGRKITKDDLEEVLFNEPFNEFYFKE